MAVRDRLIERVRTTSGLASAAVMGPDPFGGNTWESAISIPTYVARLPDDLVVNFFAVSSDLFATMGVPIVAGRNFTPADRTNAPLVAIVNQAFVRRFGGGRNVVGTSIEKDAGRRIEIVGIVRDANFSDLRQRVGPIVFLSAHQRVGPSEAVVVRAAATPSSLVQALRAIGAEIQGGLRLAPPILMRDRLADLVQPEQRLAQLCWSLWRRQAGDEPTHDGDRRAHGTWCHAGLRAPAGPRGGLALDHRWRVCGHRIGAGRTLDRLTPVWPVFDGSAHAGRRGRVADGDDAAGPLRVSVARGAHRSGHGTAPRIG